MYVTYVMYHVMCSQLRIENPCLLMALGWAGVDRSLVWQAGIPKLQVMVNINEYTTCSGGSPSGSSSTHNSTRYVLYVYYKYRYRHYICLFCFTLSRTWCIWLAFIGNYPRV